MVPTAPLLFVDVPAWDAAEVVDGTDVPVAGGNGLGFLDPRSKCRIRSRVGIVVQSQMVMSSKCGLVRARRPLIDSSQRLAK